MTNEQLMINWDNYEEYLILHADGELDEAGETALAKFIEQHPEVATELEGYEAVHLEPDMSMTYAGKEALMKPVLPAPTAPRSNWQRYALVAGIILAVGIGGALVWKSKPTAESIIPAEQPAPVSTIPAPQPVVVAPVTASVTIKEKVSVLPVNANPITKTTIKNTSIVATPKNVIVPDAIETIEALPAQSLKEEARIMLPKKVSLPQPTIVKPYMDSKPQSSFIDKLPINEDRREGLENLKENITEKLEKAKEIRKDLKDTQIAVKLGNKELHLF